MNKKNEDYSRDWYKIAGCGTKLKKDKNFQQHFILPNSMILAIGGTGVGKSTSLLEFLARKPEWYRVVIVSGSTHDEPLYNLLKNKMEGVEFKTIDELPELSDTDEEDDKRYEKLLVIDDFIGMNKKQKEKISRWTTSARKFGWTIFLMAQNLVEVPQTIRRNINYFLIFKVNDLNIVKYILRSYSFGENKDKILQAYKKSTEQPKHFFMIDAKTDNPLLRFRHMFVDFIDLNKMDE